MERLASTPGVTLKGLELSWGKQSSLNHCSGQKSFARHYLNSNWGREICTKHTHFSAHTALRNSQLTFSFIVSELCIVTFFFFEKSCCRASIHSHLQMSTFNLAREDLWLLPKHRHKSRLQQNSLKNKDYQAYCWDSVTEKINLKKKPLPSPTEISSEDIKIWQKPKQKPNNFREHEDKRRGLWKPTILQILKLGIPLT